MARIGCLTNLQNQIPKFNHNYLSILVSRSFYYVPAETPSFYPSPNYYVRTIRQEVTYIRNLVTKNYIEQGISVDGFFLQIKHTASRQIIRACFNEKLIVCVIEENAICYTTHNWIDDRFLTLDRSDIISLCREHI